MIKQLVFDHEPGITPNEDDLGEHGIELKLKAAGKIGLAEVVIRLIREKAKCGYLHPNQFNMDFCLDTISVLNRIPKQGLEKNPYEIFTDQYIDYMRDL